MVRSAKNPTLKPGACLWLLGQDNSDKTTDIQVALGSLKGFVRKLSSFSHCSGTDTSAKCWQGASKAKKCSVLLYYILRTTLLLPYPRFLSPSWAFWSLPSLIFFDLVLKRRTSDPSNLKRATTVGGPLNLIFSLSWEIERRERTNKRMPRRAVAVNKRKQRAHQKGKRLWKDQWSQARD